MIFEELKALVYQFGYENDLYSKCTIKSQIDKVEEEWNEFKATLLENDIQSTEEEAGDVQKAFLNLLKMLNLIPEQCLYRAIEKNKNRIYHVVDGKLLREDKIDN